MTSITIPNPATRQEVRADAVILRNNLDVKLPADPSLITAELLSSKYRVIIDRELEPQDDAGSQVGARVRAPSPCEPKTADILARTYTRPDGSTFTGGQMLWDIQIMVDFHKAEGLLPVAAT